MRKKVLIIVLIIVAVLGFFALSSALAAKRVVADLKQVTTSLENQDLDNAKNSLKSTKKDLEITKGSLLPFTPLKFIPVLGWYVTDAQNGLDSAIAGIDAGSTFADALTPYADILGLKGKSTFLGGTAQERLAKGIEALSKVTPQLDEIGKKLTDASSSLDKIQSWRYPNFLPGKPGDKIKSAQIGLEEARSLIVDYKPLISVLPQMMGEDKERRYLILFQNDKELRPTGGFISAYAVFRVNKGVIESEGSSDIYKLDDELVKKVQAPAPILKYLPNVYTFNLRDTNLSPDFRASMEQFNSFYDATIDKKNIDGIFALDTHFVVSLMNVLGPIEAYGTKFTTDKVKECDCPQILYELEKYADQPVAYEKSDRKGIIGVLMQQMMSKAFNAPKSSWPKLLDAGIQDLKQKHFLLYFLGSSEQDAVEKVNFAGRLYNYNGDYIHINEANFAGAKSNLFIQEKVNQKVTKDKDGKLHKVVTIEYKYPRDGDNCSLERKGGLCLAGIYRDWVRIYVPKGATLIKSSGTEKKMEQTDELDKTVFDGFFTLRPQGALKIEIEYTVPVKVDKEYKLLIQKQPGIEGHSYEIDAFGKHQKAFPLTTDKELIIKL
ncbi:DUF4012 domain-containing protein [Candidatus Curtissbacteria bacterium]|nr:DUF4012 domain-containing protein [Candidatus Curtissbacteria bacterium]